MKRRGRIAKETRDEGRKGGVNMEEKRGRKKCEEWMY